MKGTDAYSIRGLRHAYGDRTILDIPALDIPAGGISTFMGPNGCGKTTLLSILALLRTPSEGSVRLGGVETVRNRDRELRRRVTLVHQKPVLFSATVRKNIAYGLRVRGLPHREIRDRTEGIARALGLAEILDKHSHLLSGGEAQRVALARALVVETPIVLLDEPTNSLDDASRPILAQLLHHAVRSRNITVIMATHDPDIVSALSSRVFRLEGGTIAPSCG
ncbi:MAG: ABC transporter ATP-binding protein [Acidobacteria bacterium]|nr:ABC transporter ATP-binding protein [Acidobacteriota bacterium]